MVKWLIAILVFISVLAGPVMIYRGIKLSTLHTESLTITRKGDRAMQKNADGTNNAYANLVYTDKGVYNNIDSTFPWKTRSSDVYDQLQVGKTYSCTVAGWRNGFMSWYKNIVTCKGFMYQ